MSLSNTQMLPPSTNFSHQYESQTLGYRGVGPQSIGGDNTPKPQQKKDTGVGKSQNPPRDHYYQYPPLITFL